jgi:hypothetical protein
MAGVRHVLRELQVTTAIQPIGHGTNKSQSAMTIRQITQRKFLRDRFNGRTQQAVAVQDQPLKEAGQECSPPWQTAPLPSRPDDTVLSDSIPLFFIGRNHNGFWVARESAGRCGGLFLFKWSAARFARRNGLAGGGATMLVKHSIELDLPNHGSRLVELIATTTDFVKRRAPFVTNLIGVAIAGCRKLDSQISRALTDHHRNREAIENDLFRGEYKLASKNDDDLPIWR